ncbi:MAG: cell surface protein [Candidatus Bathyarchaeota archaeon B23]|nr:MAG: cell surface protein [Candidatus Bathyarchaeota archaeon B23]
MVILWLGLLLSPLAIPLLNVIPAAGDPDVIYVPDDYSTIQSAINYAEENDTIVVRAGTYKEHIDILSKKRLTIVGEEGAEATIIDGIGWYEVIRIFNSEEITLEGFTITNASDGIYVRDGNSTTIEDCIIRDNGDDGIHIGWSEEVVIRRCDIVNNTDDGLYLWSVFDALIEDVNSSDNYKNGFYLRDSRDLSISYCQAYNNNDDGFHLWGISNASMVGCVAYLNDDDGIQVFSSNNILISGCEGYHNLYGFSVSDSYDIWLLGVEGYNNSQDGLSIGGSDRICISNSQFAENDDDGLYSSASRIYISLDLPRKL